ncbi:hypothetical protein JTE90_009977 [Oedothorax gibbosus]|uniref:Secreted protein n=1 Tax=Oedothorax gibbosus TaxID=931172 RepID=A0AAV6TDW6_9ARAC|nr:hypothetical protein JTE90_009977 [Oedothorax gibbosus]
MVRLFLLGPLDPDLTIVLCTSEPLCGPPPVFLWPRPCPASSPSFFCPNVCAQTPPLPQVNALVSRVRPARE